MVHCLTWKPASAILATCYVLVEDLPYYRYKMYYCLGKVQETIFVIMSTRENKRLIARTFLKILILVNDIIYNVSYSSKAGFVLNFC